MKLSKDGWTGLAILVASLLLFALTLDLKPSPLVPIGPGFYPRLVLGLTALMSTALIAADLMTKHEPGRDAPSNYTAVALQFALFGIYAAALPALGFRIATLAYVAAANALLAPARRPSEWLRVGAIALGTTLVTYYVFEHYLLVLLPRGRWTDF